MVIAQISDLHIGCAGQLAYGRVDTASLLARTVEDIAQMVPRPDAVFATGDLVDAGQPAEYRHLRELLAPLPMPVHLIPGNHDERGALAREFADHAYLPQGGGFLHYVIDDYPVRLVALDTVIPGEGGGRMCEERCAWLDARLAEAPGRPTIIFMHHAPFRTGIARMDDQYRLDGIERMGAIVARHPQVERVMCGHLHRPIQVRWCGTVAMTSPSTAHQVALDLEAGRPLTYIMEPPAFLLHVWRGGELITHTRYVGDYAGPYAFRE